MIDSISKLNPDDRKKVLFHLHKLGEKNGHYVRYTYKELYSVAKYLSDYGAMLDTFETSQWLDSSFNIPETKIYKDILNLKGKKLEEKNYPEYVKKQNTRTRLAVGRILKNQFEQESQKQDAKSAFQKLAKIFS